MHRGKHSLNIFIRGKTNAINLMFQLKKLKNEEQIKPKVGKRK